MRNVLIIGASNRFRDLLADRLKREGFRVYILASEKGTVKPSGVQIYTFPYNSSVNREVYFSCRPDVTIFMGAYDSHYEWSSEHSAENTQTYISDLSSLLFHASETGVHQFIYLSSEAVIPTNNISLQPESARAIPNTAKGSAILLGESLVAHYAQHSLMDAVTLRLDSVYFEADKPSQCNDTLTRFVQSAFLREEIVINSKIQHSEMYVNDAVQAIFLLASAANHQRQLYHVASNLTYSEETLADYVTQASLQPLRIIDNSLGFTQQHGLLCRAFQDEFGFAARCTLDEYAPVVLKHILHNRSHFLQSIQDSQKKKSHLTLLHKLYPFVESFVCFLLVFAFQYFTSNSELFSKLDIFLIYVFTFSLIHGFYQSIFTCLLSTVGYFLLHMNPDNPLALMLDGSSYLWIAQLFILGMSVGSLRDKIAQNNDKWKTENQYLEEKLGDITAINESNVELKDWFEQRDINNREGLNYFYSIIRKLEEAPDDEMMFISVQVLVDTMKTNDVAIYGINSSDFCRLKTATSNRAFSLGKSIRMSQHPDLFQPLNNGLIYINRTLQSNRPSMAISLMDENRQMCYVLFLWDMPYEQMTQHSCNTLRLLSLIIYNYINRTLRYLDAVAHDRYLPGTLLLEDSAFRSLFDSYNKAASQNLCVISLLQVETSLTDLNAIDQLLRKHFRQDDIFGLVQQQIYVLLPNTDRNEAIGVIQRLASQHITARYVSHLPTANAPELPSAESTAN